MTSTLRERFETLLKVDRELSSYRKKLDFLDDLPGALEVGSNFYRFATFTGGPDSPLTEQIAEYSALHHAVAKKAAKGTSKFPRINERVLLKRAKHDPEVPSGMIRQYFCYADARGQGTIAQSIEIPSGYKEFAKTRKVKIRNQELIHLHEFDTTSLKNYVEFLEEKSESATSQSIDSIEKTLQKNHRFEDVKINSGFSIVGGPEALFQSSTMLGSRGGFLVQLGLHPNMPEVIYCPLCAVKALEVYRLSNGGTSNGFAFPPIPEIAFSSGILCTENVHKSHTIADCFSLDQILSNIFAIRKETGQDDFAIFTIPISSTDLSSVHGELVWLGI